MNDDAHDNNTDQPISLNNEATLDTAVFTCANPAPTAGAGTGAASTIVPDAHISPSGKTQHTKPFYPVNMKKLAKKVTLVTNLVPYSPTTNLVETSSIPPGLTVSNPPYSLINRNFPTISISTKNPSKILKEAHDDKVTFYYPPAHENFTTVPPKAYT